MLFQKSFDEKCLPVCWKSAIIVPVANKQNAAQCNDFRPVALTSIVMKCFERLFMQYLLPSVSPSIDCFQFAYQSNKSVNDAVLILIQMIAEHTDQLGCYARACFADFSSAFNTIQTHMLIRKLKQLHVKSSLILWIKDFLTNRRQTVRVQDALSETITINTGSPQGCVLSALLFILYTNECKAEGQGVTVFKYADDTVILGLVENNDENTYRQNVDRFERWCESNFLHLNSSKTKEMIFNFRRSSATPVEPLRIKGKEIEIVNDYKYLGTVIDNKLSWSKQCQTTTAKSQQRMYFLRKLRSFHVDRTIMQLFYRSVVESVILCNCLIWFGSCRQRDFKTLVRILKQAGKITGEFRNLETVCLEKILQKANEVVANESHVLHKYYEYMRSGKRLRAIKCWTERYRKSFVPLSVRMLNDTK